MQFMADELWNCDSWKPIDDPLFNFTIANMMEYFIHRKASDGIPTNHFKDMNARAFPLFKAGHIQYVVYKKNDEQY